MGTYWRVQFAAPPRTDTDSLVRAIQSRLDDLVAQMSHWAETSMLRQFDRAPAGHWLRLPPDFARVMQAGLDIADRSAGAFDPAVGRLTNAYGLGPRPTSHEPSEAEVAAAQRLGGWKRLVMDLPAGRLRQPGGLWLDLSGIAKGHAVDAVADLLAGKGIGHCLVEIGGECAGRGLRPDGDPWWVELESPPDVRLPPIRVALCQLAVATSGNYVRGDHMLDPRTGQRVRNGVVCASVLHASAMEADAWATALIVLGYQAGAALAVRENLAARLVLREGATVREWLSPALAAMLAD